MTSRTAELLNAAAARIERDGHNKGGYWTDYTGDNDPYPLTHAQELVEAGETPACDIHGAIYLETRNEEEITACGDALIASLGLDKQFGWMAPMALVQWNDDPDRTVEEVVEALRLAALDPSNA